MQANEPDKQKEEIWMRLYRRFITCPFGTWKDPNLLSRLRRFSIHHFSKAPFTNKGFFYIINMIEWDRDIFMQEWIYWRMKTQDSSQPICRDITMSFVPLKLHLFVIILLRTPRPSSEVCASRTKADRFPKVGRKVLSPLPLRNSRKREMLVLAFHFLRFTDFRFQISDLGSRAKRPRPAAREYF